MPYSYYVVVSNKEIVYLDTKFRNLFSCDNRTNWVKMGSLIATFCFAYLRYSDGQNSPA